MSGGGGFRGRGFATRGHRRQGFDGSGGVNGRPNQHDSRGGAAGLQDSMGPRCGFRGGGSRSNVQSDGSSSLGGVGMFRGDGMGGPRKNFNSQRGTSMHQSQQADGNWSANNWSGNNWMDQNMGNSWPDMGNNWANNDCANNWMDPGNNWADNNPANNWSDNNLCNNWAINNSCNNWAPRGNRPPRGNFSVWGAPTRFNSPQIPPFYRSQGQNTFGPYGFPPPLGPNYPPPPVVDFSSMPEAEPENTQKPPTNSGPKEIHAKKASKPEKQIIHPGSEEERLQKITEAADKLKRTLSTRKKAAESWYNDDDLGAAEFSEQDPDSEPRMANRGIPELKHDPPELDLTLNDLRDIGRVDHDHTVRNTKPNNEPDENIDESEVEILEHNPVQHVPEATIDIDLWPDDNPQISAENQSAERNEIPNASKDVSQPSGASLDDTTRTDNEDTLPSPKILDPQCNDAPNIPSDPDRTEAEKTSEENPKNIHFNSANPQSYPISESHKKPTTHDDFQENTKNTQNPWPQSDRRTSNESQVAELSRNMQNVQTGEPAAFAVTDRSKETSNETQTCDETQAIKELVSIGSISDERIETRDSVPTKESQNDKISSLLKPETPVAEVSSDERAENSVKKVFPYEGVINENETVELRQKCVDELEKTCGEAKPVKGDEKPMKTRSESVLNEEPRKQGESEWKKKGSSEDRADREFRGNVNEKMDSQARTRVEKSWSASRDLCTGEQRQEERAKTRIESKSLRERSHTPTGPEGKGEEKRKLVRTAYNNNLSSRSRKSTLDAGPRIIASESSMEDGASSYFDKSINSIPGKAPKEQSSPVLIKLNRRLQSLAEAEDAVQPILPPAFDPRLSSRERSALMSSSMPIKQEFAMASGYPSRPMTSLVPSVAGLNFGAPVRVPAAGSPAIKPTTSIIPPICMPEPFVPILPLANVSIVPTMVLPNELLLQPPLPVELPPPPPPPQKQTINMEAELEDMQEAMEFAKQLMNMNDDTMDPDDLLDIADESGFFHMPTFPDLPPIELSPALPADANPMKGVDGAELPTNKESTIAPGRGSKTYGPPVMSEQHHNSPTQPEESVESSSFTEEQLRREVIFNLNARSKIMSKQDERHRQTQREPDSVALSLTVPPPGKKTCGEASENRKTTTKPLSPMLVTKERPRRNNGHEDRRKRDERPRPARYEGKIDSPSFSWSNKSLEGSRSRSSTPPKHAAQGKTAKRDDEHSRNHRVKISDVTKRSGKKITSRKASNDPQTPESSWKSRVIGRFLKMSKNDIGNMLNNASLRKFDIAMKHLVKERRSSLSLEMRNTEEERMKDAELSYNREEFMDQLSAMLDPSATVDVCNLPTQFIHHLSEVLHLDTMSELDSSQTMSETLGEVSSPATQSSPNSESRKQLESWERKRRREKVLGGPTEIVESPESPLETCKVVRAMERATEENCQMKRVENRAGPRSKRRRVRAVNSDQQTNGSLTENDSSSLNMADLDDIFSAGIARAKKKTHDLGTLGSTGVQENLVAMNKDPNVDRVERATVELDEIFTAGIARAKLASKKGSESEERVWYPESLRTCLDSHTIRERSLPSGRKASKLDKWSRKVHYQEPVAFRNLTKEEWEAKNSETSYSTYQREYRAMEALRDERSRRSWSYDAKTDYNAFDVNDVPSAKSRLGEPVTGECHEHWSGSDDPSKARDIDQELNSGLDSSSTSSSTSTSSSDNEDNETSSLSVTKLLKVIKEREKIAKQKSFNEELRDEVTAEIERQKRDREKLRKSLRPKAKKNTHHRRRKEKREKVRERRKRDRKRKKRKCRRSDGGSKPTTDEEYFSSSSRPRHPSRLLNENEIKKEMKEEPAALEAGPTEKITAKSCASSESPESIQSLAHQTKTKAQLKQMPVLGKKGVATVANVNDETAKSQAVRAHEDARENILTNASPINPQTPNFPIASDNPTVPRVSNVTTASALPPQTSGPGDDTPLKTNSKKLDIKTYKERARQRQLRETEKIPPLSENPDSLTQNLSDIPVTRKNCVDATETNVNDVSNDPATKNIEGRLDNETPTSNVEKNVSAPEVVRNKIILPPTTPAQLSKESRPIGNDLPADPGKFSHIKSEGRKEMKLREKLKRGRPRISWQNSETTGPPKVSPTRLNRRSNLLTTETNLSSKELQTNKVPSTPVPDATTTPPDSETLGTPNPDDPGKVLSLSELSKSGENLDSLKNVTTPKTPELPTSLHEAQSLDSPEPPTKSLDEPEIPNNLDTPNETVVSSPSDSKSLDPVQVLATPVSTETRIEPTEVAEDLKTLVTVEIGGESGKPRATSKSPDDPESVDSSRSESTKNPDLPIEPSSGESVNAEGRLSVPETWSNLQDSAEETFAENSKAAQVERTLENVENSETPQVEEAPVEKSAEPECETCPERAKGSPESRGISGAPESSEKLVKTEKMRESENEDAELLALEMPIEELPDWSLEAPAISSNIQEALDYSNDSVPFKGFTEEAILRRDRVLTEAEITEDSELNTFESVALNFVSEEATKATENEDLEEITRSTDVVDSLDSLTYSEQFANGQDEIDASLPDPMGHAIFTVTSEIAAREVTEKASEPQEQPNDLEGPTAVPNQVETLTRLPDVLVADVNTRETVPSWILGPEAGGPKEPSDETDEAKPTLFEESSTERRNMHEPENEVRPSGAQTPEAKVIAVERNIRSEIEPNPRAPDGDDDLERPEVPDVDLEAELTKEIETIETSQKNCHDKLDDVEQSVSSGMNDKTTKKNENVDADSKPKDSLHHSKDHGHGKVKKKSSRNHNHGSKTSKRTTLTEKLVEDAITANVVKLVPKTNSRQTVMARMMEIDVEIHKLMNEKMTLYKMLESGDFTGTGNEDCVEKSVDETKVPSEKEKDAEAAQAKSSTPMIPRATEEPTNKSETKSSRPEVEDKSKKRKKSPHRESKHRSREPDSAQPRRERKASESKSRTSRITVSEETTRQATGLNSSRGKSTSWPDLEDPEDKRRKKEETTTHKSSSKRYDEHSSKEDLLEVPRDCHKTEKSAKSDSAKRHKAKKSAKPESKKPESRFESRDRKSAPEKGTTNNSENIYSDDSNFEPQEQAHDSTNNSEASGGKEHAASSTGLTLLEESLKREKARKVKSGEKRKKKSHELRRSLLNATLLTANEAKTGLMNLFERIKLHKTENSASPSSKDKTKSRNPVKVSKHISKIIDAVASNRVDEPYTENSGAVPSDENRALGDEEKIVREDREQITVVRKPEDPTSRIKKSQHPENVAKSEQKVSREEKADSGQNQLPNRDDSPATSEPEILEIPKTPDIAEEDVINFVSVTQAEVKNSRTESRSEREAEQEKRRAVEHRSRSATPEYPEPSSLDKREQKNRGRVGQPEDSDGRLGDERSWEEKRGVKIVKETTEKSDALLDDDEDDDEIIPQSRSRANSRRRKRSGKSRSRTRKERRSHHKETRDSSSRQGFLSDENDEEDASLRRPRSSASRSHKDREKAGPPSCRGSRQPDENVKSIRGRKHEHERSTSRGLSPHDGEPSRKRSHSHRSVTPTMSDHQQSKKKGRKRKRPGEMSVEEMIRCRVELIDCKYTYLSPTMHPKILKKLGISRINRYIGARENIGNWSPPLLTRNETPSPPTLSKAFDAEYSRREFHDIIEKIEIPERLESPISLGKLVEEEIMDDDEEEMKKMRVRSPLECLIVKDHEDDVDEEEEEEEDDEDDDNIQIVKVLDDNLPITSQGHEDDDVRSVKDLEPEESNRIDANGPEVIAVDGDYDTTEEYEVLDEVTDENEEATEETSDDLQVVEPSRAGPPGTENSTESDQLPEPDDNDNESEPKRTRYTVHKGPILDIKVLEDSFLAASEDGAIYRYSQTSNGILNIYKGHEAAVTCIYVLEMPGNRWNLYSGSLDGTFRCYDITSGAQDRSANIGSPVQCMDQAWGTIYIGTKSGHISRYSIKSTCLKGDKLEFSDKSVLALRASAEGPRRVLIVASRNQPITIRDANTGLFLRTICGYKNHTVYSLMRDRNLVYCGTSSTSIPVYDFTNGEQVTQYNAGVGIVCMRLYRQILFAGCYDGHIYVFDTLESKLLCSIPGPGNMLLSMEVVNDEIIAGSKNRQLHSWRMPKGVRALLAERT